MSIDWQTIGQASFDRIVEALILRRHRGTSARVRAVNGSGGDSGIDIEVIDGDRLTIYQLKYFPEGFSGGFQRTRRKQIRNSFVTALEKNPDVWILVIPRVATNAENEWVHDLADDDGPDISIMDRDELDNLLADFPDIDRWFQRDVLKEYAQIYGQERASLLGGTKDLEERLRGLGEVVDSSDPDWTVDYAKAGNCVSWSLRPQHERAHINSPVAFRVAGDFDRLPIDARETIDRAIMFGTSDTISIPRAAVTSIYMEGPKIIAGEHPPGDVKLTRLSNTPGVGKPLELKLYDSDGNKPVSHEGVITHADIGTAGGSIEAKFCDERLQVKFLVPLKIHGNSDSTRATAGAHMSIDISRGGRPAAIYEVLRIARLIRFASRIEIYIDGQLATVMGHSPDTEHDYDEHYLIVEQLAEDLDVVQRHCGQFFDIPAEVTFKERVELRVARLLIQGYLVAHPGAKELACTLDGADSEELRRDLTNPRLFVHKLSGDHVVTFGGKTLSIGQVYVIDPAAMPVNSADAIAALDRGEAEGFAVKIRPSENPYFCLALANRPAEELDLRWQALWGLVGVQQPQAASIPDAEAS